MGLINSKFIKELPESDIQTGNIPSIPISTPNMIKSSEMDPRSPSLNIARTPLELPSNDEISTLIDPRSPTTDFKRTPIIIESDLPRKIRNKNLDKIRELNTPKLLKSTPIKPRLEAYKRRSLVGLLETNIDFTETDLDKVLKEKCKIIENQVEIKEIEKNDEQFDENNVKLEDINVKFDENNVKFEENELIVKKSNVVIEEKSNSIEEEEIIEQKEIKSAPVTPIKSIDIKEFDKKLTNLIYEDDLIVCPRIVKLKEENKERSPLRICNGNEGKINKLRVNDKPRRSLYSVSKIPVYKEKKTNFVQCENTPPRNMDKKKINNKYNRKNDEWDTKDNTLYL